MSSTHDHQVEETGQASAGKNRKTGPGQSSTGESGERDQGVSNPGKGPIPGWLIGLIGLGIFWAGAYLFSFSGGFKSEVFDFEPKFGVEGGAKGPPDPKVVGKALFSANCITCHQATGLGVPGQYPPLAGSEVELGDATNHLIAIVLKGLQGPVVVAGKPFNNAMQAWEAQYTDQQLASILTYVRSDWGNNAAPITADMVKEIRAEFKDRKDQWTWPEIEKIPPKNMAAGAPAAAGQAKPGAPAPGSPSPAPNGQPTPSGQPANGQPTPAGQPAPNGQPTPSGQPANGQQAPAGQPTPTGQPTPNGQPTPKGQSAPNGQPTPAGQPAPNGPAAAQTATQSPSPAATATPSPVATPTPAATPAPTATPTPAPTPTPGATPTPAS